MSYATRVSDHVDVTSVRFYHQPMWKACVCMCRFVSKIHSRKTVLEFKELLSNPTVLSVGGWRREMNPQQSSSYDLWTSSATHLPTDTMCMDVFIDIVATDKWSLHIVAVFIQAEYFLIFDWHFSSNIYIWHCPPCASMTRAQWAISIVNPLGRISTRIIYHCHPLSVFVFLDVRCSGWMRAQRLCCPAFKNQVAWPTSGGVPKGSRSRCWGQKSAWRWSVHWCAL